MRLITTNSFNLLTGFIFKSKMSLAVLLHMPLVVVRAGSERKRGSGGDQEGDWCPSQPDATLKQTPPLTLLTQHLAPGSERQRGLQGPDV